ncbi:MAG: Gfo/Idh/MocA family oxidoreductase [Anaerolineae bacterium]|nr:Gfo/Idh/MocA family oxidoreductase [Anaerolineae bacterium]
MEEKVRVGVIGTSGYASYMHYTGIKSHPQAELMAICGRNPERTAELAAVYSIPRIFHDYHDLIESGDLDEVVVVTPDDLHYPITMQALDAGLHVLCEKPLAMNSAHAREMLDAAQTHGLVHMIMFEWRALPEIRQMKKLIDQGYQGKVYDGSIRWLAGYGRGPEYLWRADAAHGIGALGDLGSHAIDLARLFMGEIARVSAHLANHVQHFRPDGQPFIPSNDSAVLLLEFTNGAHATIEVSFTDHLPEGGCEILLTGSEGTLQSQFLSANEWIRGARKDEESFQTIVLDDQYLAGCDPATHSFDRFAGILQNQPVGARQFINAILGKAPVETTFFDGWKAQQVIDAAFGSHRTGIWVMI